MCILFDMFKLHKMVKGREFVFRAAGGGGAPGAPLLVLPLVTYYKIILMTEARMLVRVYLLIERLPFYTI